MTKQDLKQIGELLVPLKEGLNGLKEEFAELKRVQKKQTKSLVNIENTLKVYTDMYEVNKGEARKLEQRVEVVEEKLGVEPPPELVLFQI